jgi:predicted RNase H-like nuclease (RuvC/YqgF family)
VAFSDVSQTSLGVVAAAAITAISAYLAQRAKTKDAIEDHIASREVQEENLELQGRQGLIQDYKEFNTQLQKRIEFLVDEVQKLWTNYNVLQKSLEECEKHRIDDRQATLALESKVKILNESFEECERVRQHLERENSRLYREAGRTERNDDRRNR